MRRLLAFSSLVALPVLACVSSTPTPSLSGVDAGLPDATSPSTALDAGSDAPARDAATPPTPLGPLGDAGVTAPQHLTVDPATGDLYVAQFTGTYSVLTPTGVLVGTYGTGKLTNPVGIARDASGNVYIGDYGTSTVVKFDSTGTYQATFDGADSGAAPLGQITGLAIDGTGAINAADDDDGRIVRFDSSGNVLGQIVTQLDGGPATGTTAIAVAGADLWVTKYYDQRVIHIDSTGAIVGVFGASGTGALGTFEQPYGIAIDATGLLYVADNGADTVQTMTTSGVFGSVLTDAHDAGAVQPTGVALSPDGSKLYVSDGVGNRVVVYGL